MSFKLVDLVGLESYTKKLKKVIDTKMDVTDVDDTLSETSTNPVQNKVITAALNNVVSTTEVDELFEN